MMKVLEENRRAILQKEEKESGTIQEENDYTQAIDQWLEFLDDLREIEEEKKKNKDERDAEKRATLEARDELLLGLKRRQTTQLDNDDNEYSMPSSLVL